MDNPVILIIDFALGTYLICAAIFNWNWFINSHKARFVARFVENLFGREGVRLYYLILGLFFLLMPWIIPFFRVHLNG